ncbi:MAG: hypothetical protein Q4A54_13680, partial [Parabacteroides sp.]|nr:hypothetical protein [Parabacteroides sp.]
MVIMKISYNIIGILVAFLCLISCNERNVSDLQLDGDCLVTSFAVDGYEGDIDKSNKNIIVRLPENYNLTELEVTSLGLSAGADCTIDNSDVLNLSVPRTMRVTNGDVFMDWTIIVRLDEAKIKWFKINNLYTGIIDEEEKTIKVFVPKSLDLKSLTATMLVSDDAIVSPESGIPVDFTSPVTYTVTNNTAQNAYVVTVIPIGKPSALFVGLVPSMDDLNPEEKTACAWM